MWIGAFLAWSSAWAGFAADAGHGFDVGEKAAVAQGLALVEGEPDVVDGGSVQMGPEQGTVGALALAVEPIQ